MGKNKERPIRAIDILDAFFKSGVHDKKIPVEWPSVHYAVVPASSFIGDMPILVKHEHGDTKYKQTSETVLISQLTERLNKPEVKTSAQSVVRIPVKVFMNYSPHSNACEKFAAFLDEMKENSVNIEMTIIIAQLFNVDRPSISFTCHKTSWSAENADGLTAFVQRPDVVLKPFERSDWFDLFKTLVFETRRDEKEWKDLFSALFRKKAKTFARLFPARRFDEDKRIREDMIGYGLLQKEMA